MAIKSIGKITLYKSLTQAELTAMLSGTDIIVFEIEKAYELGTTPNYYGAVINSDFAGATPNYIQSLKNIIDASSFLPEQNASIYKINYNSTTKVFDLQGSYVRSNKDTSSSQGIIPVGQILDATFYTPGINGLVATTISLPFGSAISIKDKSSLESVGIELDLSVTGSLFSIKTQKNPFKVVFSKPNAVVGNYLIDFDLQNIIIEI
jgi:hypothetical protein